MDFLKKVETLINAKIHSKLPHSERVSEFDKQEAELIVKVRQALAAVEAQERVLAKRLRNEEEQAKNAEQQGNYTQQRIYKRRAAELNRQLKQESIQAIDLTEKLATIEEKLTLAREAVQKEARSIALREKQADSIIDSYQETDLPDDDSELSARKSRLSG